MSKSNVLTPYLSPLAAWGLAFGLAVGWGSFVMPGSTFLPGAGPLGTAIAVAIGGAAMAVIAWNYHVLVRNRPCSGGAFAYAHDALGPDYGFLVAWSLLLAYMAILWANATALEKLRNPGPRPFDLLVTDLKMPGMSGKDLVDAVRADPVLAKLPVFVFTADDELKNTYASMGFTGALIKPATAETVKAMLDSITAKPGA